MVEPDRFPTIMEMSSEYVESQIFDIMPNCEASTDAGSKTSPETLTDYNNLEATPKLECQQQPRLKNRMTQVEVLTNASKLASPWNCSDNNDDVSSVLDKLKSIEFRTAMGLNC